MGIYAVSPNYLDTTVNKFVDVKLRARPDIDLDVV